MTASHFRNTILVFALLCWAAPFASSKVQGEEWSIVGVLPTAVEPDTVQRLGLSGDQVAGIRDIIKKRQSQAVGLGQETRQLDPEARQLKIEEFTAESEKEGMALLTLDQKSMLQQIRLARKGLETLSEQPVAEAVGLSAEQQTKVAGFIREYRKTRPDQRDEARSRIERELRNVLDDKQWASWQSLAGLSAAASDVASTAEGNSEGNTGTPGMVEGADPAGQSSEGTIGASNIGATGEGLTLNFNKAPWEQVLTWLAKQAELSLQYDSVPQGSFTYSDLYRTYTVSETIDLINGVLLNKGYTMVRRQRMLMLIDLEQEISPVLVRELAELVSLEELDQRGEYELLKCLFVLSRMAPEDAEKEIKQLIGPQGTVVVMASAGQVLVTETAGKLRTIREMLKRVEDPESSRGSKIVSLPLKNVSAEEVLAVARPLLGLKEGENTSEDFSVSTDTFGTTIFATGKPDRIQKLKDLAEQLDLQGENQGTVAGSVEVPYIRSHRIVGSDPATAYEVIQTLLVGLPDVLMSPDLKSNQLIIRARKSEHDLVDKTLAEIAGQNESFEVIPLEKMDPETAILAINKFFGGSSDGKDGSDNGPIVDGDSIARTLWVKGSAAQVEQVKQLVKQLEESLVGDDLFGDRVKVIPLKGKAADRALREIEMLWGATNNRNRIRIVSPTQREEDKLPQRRTSGNGVEELLEGKPEASSAAEPKETKEIAPPKGEKEAALQRKGNQSKTRLTAAQVPTQEKSGDEAKVEDASPSDQPQEPAVTAKQDEPAAAAADAAQEGGADEAVAKEDEPEIIGALKNIMGEAADDIVVMRGPNGLIVTSEDPKALAQFERLLRLLSEQQAAGSDEPTVFYLQYIKAQAASELLQGILSGEAAAGGGGGGSGLIGNMASGMLGEMGGGLMGNLLGLGGGGGSSSSSSATPLASGEVSIVPDPRLNALIVQANGSDMQLVEQLIEIIDQEDSPIDVETRGKTELIPVIYQSAEEVANTVKTMFADRIAQAAGAGGAARPPSPQEFLQALQGGGGRGGRGRGAGGQSELKESTMSVGVDKRSNSLIVTGSQGLIDEVRTVVAMIDQAGAEQEEVAVTVKIDGNPEVLKNALTSVFGSQAKTTGSTTTGSTQSGSTSSSSSSQPASTGAPDAEAIQRRIEFFRAMQGAGGGGRGGFGSGFPGGGGGFPGSGGFPGGGGTQGGGRSGRGNRGGN